MKNNIFTKEVKTGILGIVAILMFIFGYNFLKGTGVFSSNHNLYAEYDDVQGLTPASYVQIKGFTIGSVKSISMSEKNKGKVLISMSVNKNFNIPDDSKASIVSLDLLGTKAISILSGQSKNYLKNEGIMQGDVMLGTLESLSSSATPAIENANKVLSSLDKTVHGVNTILDENTQNNLKASIAKFNTTMTDFSQFANELNTQKSKITQLLNNLNTFSNNLNKNNNTINKVLNNAELTTSNLSKLQLESTVNDLKKTVQELHSTLNKVNNGNGSMALLMNDDKLYKNLKNTLATANNLLYDISARPSRYINVSVFGKKQKSDNPPQPAPVNND